MTAFEIIALLLSLAAVFSFTNYKLLRLPPTIGLMIMALITSAVVMGISRFNPAVSVWAERILGSIDFDHVLQKGDKVKWDTSQGKTHGTVERKVTSETHVKTHKVAASKENPQYIVKSSKSGKTAAHKPTELRKKK